MARHASDATAHSRTASGPIFLSSPRAQVGASVLRFTVGGPDVPAVWTRWPASEGQPIGRIASAQLRAMTFEPGSMAPKVEAACRFVERTRRFAGIGAIDRAEAILRGESGTIVAA
jgi:carbamate kinase